MNIVSICKLFDYFDKDIDNMQIIELSSDYFKLCLEVVELFLKINLIWVIYLRSTHAPNGELHRRFLILPILLHTLTKRIDNA